MLAQICLAAVLALLPRISGVQVIYRDANGLLYGTSCPCLFAGVDPASGSPVISVPVKGNPTDVSASAIAAPIQGPLAPMVNIAPSTPGRYVISSSNTQLPAVPGESNSPLLQVNIQVIVDILLTSSVLPDGVLTTLTSTLTSTLTRTLTSTISPQPTSSITQTGSGGAGVQPIRTATTSVLYGNSTSSLSSSTQSSSSALSSAQSSTTSMSTPTSTPSTTSSASTSASVNLLAVLRAASATAFCSVYLDYTQSSLTATTTQTLTTNSIQLSTFTSTSTSTSVITDTLTATDTSTSTVISSTSITSTSTADATVTSISTTISSSTFSTTTTFTSLNKRQAVNALPTGISGASPSDISSACSQLISSPSPTTIPTTQTSTDIEVQSSTTSTVVSSETSTTTTQSVTTTTTASVASTSTIIIPLNTTTTTTTTTTTSSMAVQTKISGVIQVGQQANAVFPASPCSSDVDLVQTSTGSGQASFTIPQNGILTNGSSFDNGIGQMYLVVWRLVSGTTYLKVGSSQSMDFTNSQESLSYTIVPFAVQAGDILGLSMDPSRSGSNSACYYRQINNDVFHYQYNGPTAVNATKNMDMKISNGIANVQAVVVPN